MKSKYVAVHTIASFFLVSVFALQAEDQFDLITAQSNTSSQTIWRISQPNVKQASTDYPQIRFVPGDSVSIDAGGCVQTGGAGATWKQYVNPSGPNSDRLYHGEIWIPGINTKLTRVKDFAAFKKAQTIPSPLPAGVSASELYLHLGYEDDHYGDNGYYRPDDGTENQCKNSTTAYVIVSIGHNGTLAPDPTKFVGIPPADFRCQAGWAFVNFPTSRLSQSSFDNAFNLSWYDYLDPTTEITYLAARGIASSGNCEGMSLLADVGEDQFVAGDLDESFWANYKSNTTNVTKDINVAHWKQLSVTFLKGYLATVFQSPITTAAQIERDLTKANYNYGVLVMTKGTDGHVIVPIKVTHSGSKILIDVYDPNIPCSSIPDKATYPQMVINGDNWNYQDYSGSSNGFVGFSGLAYIPYLGDDGWSDLGTNISGLLTIVFGNGVNVEQVTDNTGKRLFAANQPNVIEKSAQGLGRGLVRIPLLSQSGERPRKPGSKFPLTQPVNLTAAQQKQVQAIQAQYEGDYGDSGQLFLASASQLSSLTFTLSGKTAAQPIRMLVGQGGQFYEVKSAPAAASAAHVLFTVHNLSKLEEGISVQSRDQIALKVSVAHGQTTRQTASLVIERTDDLPVSNTAVKFSLGDDKRLQLNSTAALAPVNVTTQNVDKNAFVTVAPIRRLAIAH